jgi:hypothetical protein
MAAWEQQLELCKEFEELSLVFMNELGTVTMEVDSTLEADIRKGHIDIKQLIKSNKTC